MLTFFRCQQINKAGEAISRFSPRLCRGCVLYELYCFSNTMLLACNFMSLETDDYCMLRSFPLLK